MVKIVSGHSGIGGSTEAFINLTNYLNDAGIDTCYYGPQSYHLDKCNGKLVQELSFKNDDVCIYHIRINFPDLNRKIIYSCHERFGYFDINPVLNRLESVHFVSEQQKNSYGLNSETFVLPNILPPINIIDKPKIKVGGIIGTIFGLKNTHISIEKALVDGCEKILLYGNIGDYSYYNQMVKPYVDKGLAIYCGHEVDKVKIYSSITDAYHYSQNETWGYVEGESYITKTNFHKPEHLTNFHFMENEDIIKKWIEMINK